MSYKQKNIYVSAGSVLGVVGKSGNINTSNINKNFVNTNLQTFTPNNDETKTKQSQVKMRLLTDKTKLLAKVDSNNKAVDKIENEIKQIGQQQDRATPSRNMAND